MEFNFKDEKIATLFQKNAYESQNKFVDEELLFAEEEIIVQKKELYVEKNSSILDVEIQTLKIIINIQSEQLKRIESKQNAVLEILNSLPLPTVAQIKIENIQINDIRILELNLELFNSKLIILSTKNNNEHIENLLTLLNIISEYIVSNSFYVFVKENSPLNKALLELNYLGLGNSKFNQLITKTELLLQDIVKYSGMRIFEKSYFFSNLLLEKGLILNAITLLNETISIYIVESVKKFSKKIQEYIFLVAEKDSPALYSRVKEFFIKQYSENTPEEIISFFPFHISIKEIDSEIIKKFKNLNTTWSHKGDSGLFQRYAYIVKRVRSIRNNVAHGNLEIDYKTITNELKILNDDFYYLAIKKNIFKY